MNATLPPPVLASKPLKSTADETAIKTSVDGTEFMITNTAQKGISNLNYYNSSLLISNHVELT